MRRGSSARGPRDNVSRLLLRVTLLSSAAWLILEMMPARIGRSHAGGVAHDDGSFTCSVAHVDDGDTMRCADGMRVRLHGIAAREIDESCRRGHPCPEASGAAARHALERLALGETLTCEATGTTYGRIAALCRTAIGVELSCAMVERGYALRWERYDRQRRICA